MTFFDINSGLGDPGLRAYVLTYAIDPVTPATVYAGADRGIYKSVDAGNSWTAVNNGLPASSDLIVRTVVVDLTNPSVVYAATEFAGVYRTTDGGAHWTPLNDGLSNPHVHALVLDAKGRSLHAATLVGNFDFELPSLPHRRAVRR